MLRLPAAAVAVLLASTSAAVAAPQRPAPPAEAQASRDVLPPTFRPAAYDVHLSPDLTALTVAGEVTVTGEAPAAGSAIVLNAKALTLDEARLDGQAASAITYDAKLGRATLTFAKPFAAGRHALAIRWHGKIPKDSTLGLFAMDYDTAAGPRRTLATNLEPAEARAVFPCWDEPGLKANFTVTVDAPADRTALSNMPQVSATPLPGGMQRVRFKTSPKMSTYLFFVGVGDWERVHRTVDGVDVGVVVNRGEGAKAQYALDQASALLHYYNDWFGVRYPLPKLDLIAAPGEIQGGSMENWGAIFYSQEHLLLDPERGTPADRQLVFLVVAHEMAHQWFGDLVTMDWWDNLWLNEGFARWMQTRAADALHPQWKTGLQAADIFERGKRTDAGAGTHPVVQQIQSAEQAGQAFDNITYNKGAAVITMLEAYVGPDAFRAGVRRYMKAHRFGNTVDADLWGEIQRAAGKPVLAIEQDFTRQSGVPLVRVAPVAGGGVHLTQAQFAEDPDSLKGQPARTWRLPLTVAPAGGPAQTLVLNGQASAAGEAPLVNAGGLAYARVAYPPAHAAALAARSASLQPIDELNLMNDAWALGESGYAPASNLLAFIAALPADAEPVVWRRAVALLVEVDDAYDPGRPRAAYRAWALKRLAPLADRMGIASRPGEDANVTTLRADLWRAEAQFGNAAAVSRARQLYWSDAGGAAERRAALDVVGLTADAATFDRLLVKARATKDPLERMQILSAAARTHDPALARRVVEVAAGPDTPAGGAPSLLARVGAANPDTVWAALQPHLAQGDLPLDRQSRWGVVTAVAGASSRPERIAEVQAFGEKDIPPEARKPVAAAVGSIRLNARVKAGALPDVDRWVAEH